MNNFDDLKLATEAMTGGKNTVLLDDVGMPSIMVVVPKMNSKDLVTGATDEPHPAFIVDGVEKDKVYISKYINIVNNSRAYSLPMQDPYVNVNFDNALAYCRNKGNGWGLTPYILWSAVALWCKKNGTQPRGNNNYSSDSTKAYESGVVTSVSDGKGNRTATGSGPVSWNHDATIAGICDMNGNVSEWNAGIRLVAGTLQVIPYANCMKPSCDMGSTSADWKIVGVGGTFSDTGVSMCVAFNTDTNRLYWSTTAANSSATNRSTSFMNIIADESITDSGKIFLRKMALLPEESDTDYNSDNFWVNNANNEALALRGGQWLSVGGAGVFYTHLGYGRSYAATNTGFRSVYYEL